MHKSAYNHVEKNLQKYFNPEKHKRVVDIGSRQVQPGHLTHRTLIEPLNVNYVGLDIVAGPNVDLVMKKPYRLPLKSNSVDIIICGQAFEHIPYFWITFMEMARVLAPGGIIIITAPSRGHVHSPPTDCWRFYPDGMRALAKFSDMELLFAETDFPALVGREFGYSNIDPHQYWGDTVGVFTKTKKYKGWKTYLVREVMIRWANKRNRLKTKPNNKK